jgi:hypothetical protein
MKTATNQQQSLEDELELARLERDEARDALAKISANMETLRRLSETDESTETLPRLSDHDRLELDGFRRILHWLREDHNRTLTASPNGRLCASQLEPWQLARGVHVYADDPIAMSKELK